MMYHNIPDGDALKKKISPGLALVSLLGSSSTSTSSSGSSSGLSCGIFGVLGVLFWERTQKIG